MTKLRKKLGLLAAILAGAFVLGMLPACHTVEGAGRDVQSVGEGVERGADATRPYN